MKTLWIRVLLIVALIAGSVGGIVLASATSSVMTTLGVILLVLAAIAFLVPYIVVTVTVARRREWIWLAMLIGFWFIPALQLGIPFVIIFYGMMRNDAEALRRSTTPPLNAGSDPSSLPSARPGSPTLSSALPAGWVKPSPSRTWMLFSKRQARRLVLISLSVGVIGALLIGASQAHLPSILQAIMIVPGVMLAVLAVGMFLVAWGGANRFVFQQKRWGWFMAMFVSAFFFFPIAFIAFLVFLIIGPQGAGVPVA